MVNLSTIRLGFFAILLLCILFPHPGSLEENLQFIKQHNPIIEEKESEDLSFSLKETSEIKLSALWYIRFYQNFISTQHDKHKMCTFVPSCSRFGVEVIKHYGFLKGILLTSDRLQRCNNLGESNYIIDIQTGKRVDSVRKYVASED